MTKQEPIIESHAVEPFFKNGYLVACPVSRQGIYIDPGDEAPELLERAESQGINLIAIVNTHAHMDHICGINTVKQAWDVPIHLHPEDRPLYDRLPQQGQWVGVQYEPPPPVDHDLKEGDRMPVGSLLIQVFHTPGHSPGHVCLEVGRHIFCGDTVFAGSIGRTDLPGGSMEVLMQSIREKILTRGDDKILYPGHGPVTTVGREKATNPFLLGGVEP